MTRKAFRGLQLKELHVRVRTAEEVLGIEEKKSVIAKLETVTLEPGFWDDQSTAQQVMSDIARHQEELQMVSAWRGTLDDICVALELQGENEV